MPMFWSLEPGKVICHTEKGKSVCRWNWGGQSPNVEWGEMSLDCARGLSVLTEFLKGEERESKEIKAKRTRARLCPVLLTLNMEEGAIRQGMWASSRS